MWGVGGGREGNEIKKVGMRRLSWNSFQVVLSNNQHIITYVSTTMARHQTYLPVAALIAISHYFEMATTDFRQSAPLLLFGEDPTQNSLLLSPALNSRKNIIVLAVRDLTKMLNEDLLLS